MRGRPFRLTWQDEDTTATLKATYQTERDPSVRQRVQGLWLLRSGWSLSQVAAALGVQYRTVQRWVAWYRAGGLAQVRQRRMGGRGQTPFLTPEAELQVGSAVATGRFRTAAEVRDWVHETYAVTYTLGGIYSLLDRLQCAPKVPRPLHIKADLSAQAQFKKGGLRPPLLQPV